MNVRVSKQGPELVAMPAPNKPAVFTFSASRLRDAFDLSMTTYEVITIFQCSFMFHFFYQWHARCDSQFRKERRKKAKKKLETAASSDVNLTDEAVVVETTAVLTATKEAKVYLV